MLRIRTTTIIRSKLGERPILLSTVALGMCWRQISFCVSPATSKRYNVVEMHLVMRENILFADIAKHAVAFQYACIVNLIYLCRVLLPCHVALRAVEVFQRVVLSPLGTCSHVLLFVYLKPFTYTLAADRCSSIFSVTSRYGEIFKRFLDAAFPARLRRWCNGLSNLQCAQLNFFCHANFASAMNAITKALIDLKFLYRFFYSAFCANTREDEQGLLHTLGIPFLEMLTASLLQNAIFAFSSVVLSIPPISAHFRKVFNSLFDATICAYSCSQWQSRRTRNGILPTLQSVLFRYAFLTTSANTKSFVFSLRESSERFFDGTTCTYLRRVSFWRRQWDISLLARMVNTVFFESNGGTYFTVGSKPPSTLALRGKLIKWFFNITNRTDFSSGLYDIVIRFIHSTVSPLTKDTLLRGQNAVAPASGLVSFTTLIIPYNPINLHKTRDYYAFYLLLFITKG
jgi:hypothetical protein